MAAPQTISALMINAFDRALHGVPQHGAMLKDTIRVVSGVGAEDHRFHAIGKAIARTRAALQPIQASPTVKAKPKATLELKEHYEFLDDFEASRLSVSAMAGYGRNSRLAVERACDEWVIRALRGPNNDAIGAAIAANTAAKLAPDLPANQDIAAKLTTIADRFTQLLRRGVGTGDMLTLAYSDRHFPAIVSITQLISRDYSSKGMIATGRPPPLFGMQWRGMEDREEGGIAVGEAWMYAKNGTGLALGNIARMRDISWRNDLNAWQIGARITGGATVIDRNMLAPLALQAP